MKRKFHTASGKNGTNRPKGPDYDKDLLYHSKDRMVHEVMQTLRGLNNTEAAAGACAPGTIAAWRRPWKDGGTKYPRAITMNAVLHKHYKKLGVVDM